MKTRKMTNKMKSSAMISLLFVACCLLTVTGAFSQGIGINATGVPADNSAMLDVSATNAGFLMPRVSLISNTDATTIPSPATYLLVFNTNASMTLGSGKGVYYWDGTQWRPVGGGAAPCSAAPATPGAISGNVAVCTGGIGTYFVAPVTGAASYTWTYTGTGATISGTSNSVVISFSSSATSGNLSVTATNACGTSASSANFSVTVNGTPVSTFTPTVLIPGQTVTFIPTAIDNQLYFWQTPDPSVQSTATSPTLTLGTTLGNVALTVTKSGCNSTTVVSELSNSQPFNFTGAQQTFTVPSGVTTVDIIAWGAQGGNSSAAAGGKGGYSNGALTVIPGQTLNIYVGGQNGYNGGGSPGSGGSWPGVYGGGASDVRVGGSNLANRVIVAGGGGGGGTNGNSWTGYPGGAGGGTSGSNGNGSGGLGGTQNSGGGSGSSCGGCNGGTSGTSGIGGNGSNPCSSYGTASGGGGGYYGGGGGGSCGDGGGGGGGSSYIGGVTNGYTSSDVQTGNGMIKIAW